MVIAAAVPSRTPAPAEAMQAAPIAAMDAVCAGTALPDLIMSVMLRATWRPITADGMPVRGGAGEITVPLGLLRGVEIGCGGANAMPIPNTLAYCGDW